MGKDRLAAFSDGVIAIIITIMVLELKLPDDGGSARLSPSRRASLSYVLSFIYLAIYWNNHHHMLHTVTPRRRAHPVGELASVVLAVAHSGGDRLARATIFSRRCRPRSTACRC